MSNEQNWGSQAARDQHIANGQQRDAEQNQPQQQQPQTTRDILLARLAQQEAAGLQGEHRHVDHAWSNEVTFDDTAWARPESGPLADAVDLQGRPCVVTRDTNPDHVIVQVRGIGMRLSNALKLGLIVDDVAEHIGHPSAAPQATPATTTAPPRATQGQPEGQPEKAEPIAPLSIDIAGTEGESIGAELDAVAELAQSSGQDFGAVVKAALETGELNPTVAQAMVRAGMIDDVSHGTEWAQGAIAAAEAAVAKNFTDAGYQGVELLAAVTERASAGELQQAALQLILGKGDVSGFVKLARLHVLDRGHGALFARSY